MTAAGLQHRVSVRFAKGPARSSVAAETDDALVPPPFAPLGWLGYIAQLTASDVTSLYAPYNTAHHFWDFRGCTTGANVTDSIAGDLNCVQPILPGPSPPKSRDVVLSPHDVALIQHSRTTDASRIPIAYTVKPMATQSNHLQPSHTSKELLGRQIFP